MRRSNRIGTWSIPIRIPITIGAIAGILAALLTLFYWLSHEKNLDRNKNTVDFLAKAIGIAAGVTSAFYVGASIERNLDEKQIDRALNYIAEWNNPSRDPSKKEVVEKLKDAVAQAEEQKVKDYSQYINPILREDKQLEESLRNLLNFLEDMAISVDRQLADETILQDYFVGIVKRYCSVFSSWIEVQNARPGRESSFQNLKRLNDRWLQQRNP